MNEPEAGDRRRTEQRQPRSGDPRDRCGNRACGHPRSEHTRVGSTDNACVNCRCGGWVEQGAELFAGRQSGGIGGGEIRKLTADETEEMIERNRGDAGLVGGGSPGGPILTPPPHMGWDSNHPGGPKIEDHPAMRQGDAEAGRSCRACGHPRYSHNPGEGCRDCNPAGTICRTFVEGITDADIARSGNAARRAAKAPRLVFHHPEDAEESQFVVTVGMTSQKTRMEEAEVVLMVLTSETQFSPDIDVTVEPRELAEPASTQPQSDGLEEFGVYEIVGHTMKEGDPLPKVGDYWNRVLSDPLPEGQHVRTIEIDAVRKVKAAGDALARAIGAWNDNEEDTTAMLDLARRRYDAEVGNESPPLSPPLPPQVGLPKHLRLSKDDEAQRIFEVFVTEAGMMAEQVQGPPLEVGKRVWAGQGQMSGPIRVKLEPDDYKVWLRAQGITPPDEKVTIHITDNESLDEAFRKAGIDVEPPEEQVMRRVRHEVALARTDMGIEEDGPNRGSVPLTKVAYWLGKIIEYGQQALTESRREPVFGASRLHLPVTESSADALNEAERQIQSREPRPEKASPMQPDFPRNPPPFDRLRARLRSTDWSLAIGRAVGLAAVAFVAWLWTQSY